ncbi:MAG TPA: hypothetical protein VKT80_14430 [Chloroflexota bacterium]|jgi:hypothetical protein|nr:hypothetical protein [Chloroflexota bacterium]
MRREGILLWLALPLAALGSGCISTESHLCTLEARSSVQVSVVGPNGAICDANVRVQIGNETIPLMTFGSSDCTYSGVYERSGSMTVTASKTGFQSASTSVNVPSDECHVITQKVTLTLTPS